MITVKPIAFVQNKRNETKDDFWGDVTSEIILADDIPEGAFDGIEEFSHLEIIFHFNKVPAAQFELTGIHPRNNKNWPKIGIFAMRKRKRPNHLGLTTVRLLKRAGRILTVELLDADNGSPVLDIKPVMKEFMPQEEVRQPVWSNELMKDYWSK